MKVPRYTSKVIELFQQAHKVAEVNRHTSIQSIDIFIGASLMKKGTLMEMHYLVEPYTNELEKLIGRLTPEPFS